MPESFRGLKVKDFLGVFYREDGRLMVADEFEGARNVDEEISRYADMEVRLVVHHRPVEPPDDARWGGGCCMLESSGHCHFGHHEDPRSAFQFNAKGVLGVEEDGRWFLSQEDGTRNECIVEFLVGHRSQIIVTTIPDLESLDEKVKSFDPSKTEGKTIDELTEQLTDMRDLLSEINRLKNDIDA
jgi:hypothetical protein